MMILSFKILCVDNNKIAILFNVNLNFVFDSGE